MFVYNFISNLVFGVTEFKQSKPQKTAQIPINLSRGTFHSTYCSNRKPINPHSKYYQQLNSNQQHFHYHQYNKQYSNKKSSFQKARYSKSPKMPPAAYSTFHTHSTTASAYVAATMNSPNTNNSSNKTPNNRRVIDNDYRYKVVDDICAETNLYTIIGVDRGCSSDELRRAYISRSRICHPDKFPEYPKATEAFQKLAYAYETLNKPSTRRAYDISGTSDLGSVNGTGDETLHGVLYQLFLEFMDGDFEMIRALVNALNEGNPGLNLGEDAIETLETAFRRMRELLLAGKKYVKIVQFELIRLYEIQQQLRTLSYFDVLGRLRLTIQLARITLTIPLLIDNSMKAEFEHLGGKPGMNKGLLGDGMAKVIAGLVTILDRGEKFV
ncbi:28042_t:CDS:2 [Dentiscutata erythropus]|uniref:28042_t:CDS:1 n=1 Tax=Dentiscutata erythropus TaxID=1348616 RepID=A0A9N9H3Y0_9GLOM|nr:28042_t:CDS:2 [Dentiscutata erythropus]